MASEAATRGAGPVRIEQVEVRGERLPLARPYTIARQTFHDVDLLFVRIVDSRRREGLGSASPAVEVTGESAADCRAALDAAAHLLVGEPALSIGRLARRLEREFPRAPAARAALDMALWDLLGRHLDAPVVDLLGRAHQALPTSVTIGIGTAEAAVAEARDHVARGFRVLKVKLGHDVEEDIDRLRRLRAAVGDAVALRADANAGYDRRALRRYLEATADLALEFCEQPVPRGEEEAAGLEALAGSDRDRLAADESVHDLADAARLAGRPRRPYGIFNLKLMKSGGISPALKIAHLAEGAGVRLMWGCNDESRVSIAAALHAALASPATRFLDLDGSFDLGRDLVAGGFVLEHGMLRTAAGAGLGVEWLGGELGGPGPPQDQSSKLSE